MRLGITVYEADADEGLLINIVEGVQATARVGETFSVHLNSPRGIVLERVDLTPPDPDARILGDEITLTDGGISS